MNARRSFSAAPAPRSHWGRTGEEEKSLLLVCGLLRLRHQYPALQLGRLIQFAPLGEVYAYFRILGTSTLPVAVNNNESAKSVLCDRFREFLPGGAKLRQLTGERHGAIVSADRLDLDAPSATVFEVMGAQ